MFKQTDLFSDHLEKYIFKFYVNYFFLQLAWPDFEYFNQALLQQHKQKAKQISSFYSLKLFEGHLIATFPIGVLSSYKAKYSVLYYNFPPRFQIHTINCYLRMRDTDLVVRGAVRRNYAFPKFVFKLDALLRLNITFQNLYFSYKYDHADKCRHQLVSITSDGNIALNYCRILPEFQSYPKSSAITVEVNSTAITEIKVSMFYFVIDVNLMQTEELLPFQTEDMSLNFAGVLAFTNHSVEFYFVRIKHYKKVVVQTPLMKYLPLVYDGAGRKSKLLKQTKTQTYVSSYFQVTVYAFFPNRGFQISTLPISFYSERQGEQITISNISSKVLLSTYLPCKSQMCIFNLQTNQASTLKLRLQNVSYAEVVLLELIPR